MNTSRLSASALRNKAGALLLALLAGLNPACRLSPRHPPTFADFQRVGPGMLEDVGKIQQHLALQEAAIFHPAELQRIQARGNAQEIVGAALVVKVGDTNLPALWQAIREHGVQDPVAITGLAASLARELANGDRSASTLAELKQALENLEALEPDNGVPAGLRAFVEWKQGHTNAARELLLATLEKPSLRLRGPELRRCVRAAAAAVHYPSYTASMLALGSSGLNVELMLLGRALLKDPAVDRGTAAACLELGRRQEAQATLFIEVLMSLALQKLALETAKPPGWENELQRQEGLKAKFRKATLFLDGPEGRFRNEAEGLAFYETLWAKSEAEAVEALVRQRAQKF